MTAQNNEVLDATVPDPNESAPGLDQPTSKAYDPEEFKDQARKRITYWTAFQPSNPSPSPHLMPKTDGRKLWSNRRGNDCA